MQDSDFPQSVENSVESLCIHVGKRSWFRFLFEPFELSSVETAERLEELQYVGGNESEYTKLR